MTALISGSLQVLVMIWIGYMVGLAFGLSSGYIVRAGLTQPAAVAACHEDERRRQSERC